MSNRNERKQASIISHTHWDREWYMPYEKHHVRLVALMDTLLDLLERDPDYRSFHLDGQTIVLDDYLEIRPERRDQVRRLVREGRLHVGPWYVLQDEFLTSPEANVRNLLIGIRDAEAYGAVCRVGYFPDSFGNMGQAPQLLRQAGIDNAVFGRGVKPTGFGNQVSEGGAGAGAGAFESPYSEMLWEAPDGSRVLGVLFANWYHNGMEIPADAEEARAYWQRKLADAERYASTRHLLFMNGCDHQPVQTDLSAALRTARALYPDVDFVHASFPEYLRELQAALPDELAVVRGELRSQQTDGWGTLVNTASARMYVKQANHAGQTLLEKVAEPLAAMAALSGAAYPHHLLAYAWKTLMQNHPHDSICGCSVDEVHREMMTRFAKSRQVAEAIADRAAEALTARIDSAPLADGGLRFTVFNTTGWRRSGVVTVELDVYKQPFEWGGAPKAAAAVTAEPLGGVTVLDAEGRAVAARVEDLGACFGYDLPNDRFRQPYMARRLRLTLAADGVPALGYRAYAVTLGGAVEVVAEPVAAGLPPRVLENAWIRAEIADDGSLALTDKRTGRQYADLLVYEDGGDIGNEYLFRAPNDDVPLTTRGLPAEIACLEADELRIVYEIRHRWAIPASADETLAREQQAILDYGERRAGRVSRTVPLELVTRVTLDRDLPYLQVQTRFRNEARDHRLRVLFPTDVETATHRADSIFEVALRDIAPAASWKNPSNCQHQQAFVDVSGVDAGLTIANLGLPEYEVLRDGRNTIALTLLRCVGELGDWGYFPTPEAQCLGDQEMSYAILPHGGEEDRLEAYALAYQTQVPWTVRQHAAASGVLPAQGAFLAWAGRELAFSALKLSERTGDLVARWFNLTDRPAALRVSFPGLPEGARPSRSTVLEDEGEPLAASREFGGAFELPARPAEIVTVRVPLAGE